MPDPSRIVDSADGTPIAVFTSGEGPPLVLVHGAAADHTTFRVIGPRLAERYAVHAIDRRGRGRSGDTLPYTIEREFEDVAAVAETVAAGSGGGVAVIGHSYGGRCALGADGTIQAVAYGAAVGLPSAIPCLGTIAGWIWWAVSSAVMLRHAQGVSPLRAAQVLGNMGGVYAALGDHEQAYNCYIQAADTFQELGEKKMHADTMIAISTLQVKERKFVAGLDTYEEGMKNLEKLTPQQRVLRWAMRRRNQVLKRGG